MADRIRYVDLWEKWDKKLPRWNRDREFFNLRDFLRFGVMSGMSPQVVEQVFVEILVEIASREPKAYKHILLPREHTKSSLLCSLSTYLLAYPHQQVWGPRVRIAFDAEVKELSERNTAVVMQALESNPLILQEQGCQKPDKDWLQENKLSKTNAPWNIKKFKTLHCIKAELEAGVAKGEPSGTTVSSQKSTTGRHYDFRLGDDPVTGRTADSDPMKRKARKSHMEMQSQLSIANSLQAILGTRHADDDIHYSIQQEFSANFTFQCRTVWDGGPELYKDDFTKNENGRWVPNLSLDQIVLLWNGVGQLEEDAAAGGFPADENERKSKALHFLRSRMDDYDALTWTRNMLNRSIPDQDRIFTPAMFRPYSLADFRSQDVLNYVLTDAASGRDFRSSYRVVAVVGMDRGDNAYIRHVEYGHWSPSDFCKRILEAAKRYTVRSVVLEEMSWRETFQSNIQLTAQVMGVPLPRIEVVKGINAMSKRSRVESMEPRFQNQKITFNPELRDERDAEGRPKWDEIVSQFLKIQDIDTQPKLKVDVADALSLIDGVNEKGDRICRPPRGGPLTRNEALLAANLRSEGGVIRPGANAAIRLSLERSRANAPGRRSLFGGHRTLGK